MLVGKLIDGRRPGGYYVDPTGTRVRWHLGAALEASAEPSRRADAEALRRVTRRFGSKSHVGSIDLSSKVLRKMATELPLLVERLFAQPPQPPAGRSGPSKGERV